MRSKIETGHPSTAQRQRQASLGDTKTQKQPHQKKYLVQRTGILSIRVLFSIVTGAEPAAARIRARNCAPATKRLMTVVNSSSSSSSSGAGEVPGEKLRSRDETPREKPTETEISHTAPSSS